MPLPLPDATDFELTPAGSHVAVCYRIVDLGTQLIEYNGETKKQHKIMVGWELSNEFMQTGDNAGKIPPCARKLGVWVVRDGTSMVCCASGGFDRM